MNTNTTPAAFSCRESAHNLHINVGQTLGMAQAEGIMQLLASRKDNLQKIFHRRAPGDASGSRGRRQPAGGPAA